MANDVGTQYQLSGLEPGSHYQFEGCSQPGDYPFCVNADGEAGIVFPGQDGPGEPIDSFDTKSLSNLVPVDGGPNYYSQFSNPLPTEPSFFPIGVWFESVTSSSDVALDKGAGLNTYVALVRNSVTEGPTMTQLVNQNMHGIFHDEWYDHAPAIANTHNAGWWTLDEADMNYGPGAGETQLQNQLKSLPHDGRMTDVGYGKGVLFWETNAEASAFVNYPGLDIVQADTYFFTDPFVDANWCQASDPSLVLTNDCHNAANYGWIIDRERMLDGLDGVRKPIWAVVEVGWPFSEPAAQGGRAITPNEIRAAVWASIIAGARGIIYFNHSFGGPCPSQHVLREPCYAAERAMVTSVNAQITQLAPVLNSPSDPSYVTVSAGIRTMAKLYNGTYYVFADSSDGNGHAATFRVPSGTTATVEGEGRTISITNGQFTDNFADGNAIHIYRIDD